MLHMLKMKTFSGLPPNPAPAAGRAGHPRVSSNYPPNRGGGVSNEPGHPLVGKNMESSGPYIETCFASMYMYFVRLN